MKKRIFSAALAMVFALMFAFSGVVTSNVSAAEVPELAIKGCNLEVGDTVYIKYAVPQTSGLKLSVRKGTPDASAVTLSPYDTMEVGGTTYSVFRYAIAAKELADNIYAQAFVGDDYGPVSKYSALEYAKKKIENPASEDSLVELLEAMLAYGAAAQRHFNYNEDRLATATFYTVEVTGGTLADGTTKGLFAVGESATVTAPANNGTADFANWNGNGFDIPESVGVNEYTFTVTQDSTYEAVYGEAGEIVSFADFDFADGAVSVNGALNISNVNFTGTVKPTQVTYKGTTALLDAYVTFGGQHGTYQFDDYNTPEAMDAFMNEGFTVEAFYVMPNKTVAQGVICAAATYTSGATKSTRGWGLAQRANGRPYFISGIGATTGWSQTPDAGAATPINDLVHVVAVYEADPVNTGKYKETVYVNGVVYGTASNLTGVANAAGTDCNKFCVGAGYGQNIGFLNQGMVMVDAKIYAKALDADAVAAAEAAAALFVNDNAISVNDPTPVAGTPTPYADIDFDLGFAYDRLGKVNTAVKGTPTFGETTVAISGSRTATLNAMNVNSASGGQYVLCNFITGGSYTNLNTFVNGGFSVETFYVLSNKKDGGTNGNIVGIVCATENDGKAGGWGLAENAGAPYFCTSQASAYNSAPKASIASTTELVHVVATYDAAGAMKRLYVNGVQVGTGESVAGKAFTGITNATSAANYFCLAADLRTSANNTLDTTADMMAKNLTMVDTKIYNTVLTSAQVTATYQNATAPFAVATPEPSVSASGVYADLNCL